MRRTTVIDVAMVGGGQRDAVARGDIHHVAVRWPDIQDRRTDAHDVVDLASVHDAHQRIAHHHHVQIGGGKRCRKIRQRLVGQAQDIRQVVRRGEVFDGRELAAAAHEAEHNFRSVRELLGRFQHGRQRMAGAVIAGIHHHVLAFQSMAFTEGAAAVRIVAHHFAMRPRRQHGDFFRRHAFRRIRACA